MTIPRKTVNENLIKVVNVSFIEEGIINDDFDNSEVNNKNEEEKKYSKNANITKFHLIYLSINNEIICNKYLCNGICNIF